MPAEPLVEPSVVGDVEVLPSVVVWPVLELGVVVDGTTATLGLGDVEVPVVDPVVTGVVVVTAAELDGVGSVVVTNAGGVDIGVGAVVLTCAVGVGMGAASVVVTGTGSAVTSGATVVVTI